MSDRASGAHDVTSVGAPGSEAIPCASPNQDNSIRNALTLLHAAHLRALCRRLAAAALLGACAAPRIVTAPSAESCPAGYRFLYTDHLANDTSSRAVCGPDKAAE